MLTHKTCSICQQEKPLIEFYRNREGRAGHLSRCKGCLLNIQKDYSLRPKVTPETKRCSACGVVKSAAEFTRRSCVPSGLSPQCRTCREKHRWTPKSKYRVYKTEAARRKIPFDLPYEEFITYWQVPCSYCGGDIDTIGLDRIDNSHGYTSSNITSCCSECNYSKGESSLVQWIEHINKVTAYLRRHPLGD